MFSVSIVKGSATARFDAANWYDFADMVPLLVNAGFSVNVSEKPELSADDIDLSALLAKDYTPVCHNGSIWGNTPFYRVVLDTVRTAVIIDDASGKRGHYSQAFPCGGYLSGELKIGEHIAKEAIERELATQRNSR